MQKQQLAEPQVERLERYSRNPSFFGKYDIVIDVNGNEKYDEDIDALDDEDIEVTAGFFVILELPFGTILGLAACIVALGVYKSQQSLRLL